MNPSLAGILLRLETLKDDVEAAREEAIGRRSRNSSPTAEVVAGKDQLCVEVQEVKEERYRLCIDS